MAIIKSFKGQSIAHPGAYSSSVVSLAAGSPLAANATLLILGEADAGSAGSEEGIQVFPAAAISQLIAKYKTGPIVDAARAAMSPSKTPGVNGAGIVKVWKTNVSVAASLALANTYGTLAALEKGIGGNRVTYKNVLGAETAPFKQGSAAVTNFAGLDTETLIIQINGEAAQTCTFVTPANLAAVISQIEAAITGVDASDAGAGVLKVALAAASNHHRDGYGRAIEILSTSTALTKLFLTAGSAVATAEPTASITITQPRDGVTEANTVGGDIVMQIARSNAGGATSAEVEVTDVDMTLTDSVGSVTLAFADYPTMGALAVGIGNQTGWTVTLNSLYSSAASSDLDEVTGIGAFSQTFKPCRLKADAAAVAEIMAASIVVEIEDQAQTGLPDERTVVNLTGGARGASASSDFDAGLTAALAEDANVIVPAISQDASADIALGLTDPASAYDIETVHAMLGTHLILRGSIKNRREAQGVVGYRKAAKADVYSQAASIGNYLIQVAMQDVQFNGEWKQPHVMAAMMAGMRLGMEPGTPMTYKFLNASGIGHYVNLTTGAVGGDFNPLIDGDLAIAAGVTFAEPVSGGFRVVVDNTTYGVDASFIYNRGSVINAAIYIAKNVRDDAEAAFIGQKTAVVSASTLKARIRTKLIELFDARMMTAGDGAQQGFKEDTFVVTIEGNTASVQVEVIPVQGLDFIFIEFTLGEATQTA